MTAFNDMMAADVAGVFLQEFAERVVYTPQVPTTANPIRTITAVVFRDPPSGMIGAENWVVNGFIIRVGTDPTNAVAGGIDPANIDTGGDTITLANRAGQAQKMRVQWPKPGRTDAQDPAMITLQLM